MFSKTLTSEEVATLIHMDDFKSEERLGITLEEVLQIVKFTRSPDGDLLVQDVLGSVWGDVQGSVRGSVSSVTHVRNHVGDVDGDVDGDVWGRMRGKVLGNNTSSMQHEDPAIIAAFDCAEEVEE